MDSVAVVSGGLDSTVMLYWLKSKNLNPLVVTFTYGQRHDKEVKFAHSTALKLGYKWVGIDLPLFSMFSNSALINKTIKLPEEHYTHENQMITVVPNRNMILLSIAVGIAEHHNVNSVYYAAHSNDYAIYPDCRPEFVNTLSLASQIGTYNNVTIQAPFLFYAKSDIVNIGNILQVPFDETWSCYRGSEIPCGVCATCQERIEAFMLNNLKDPLYTGEQWEEVIKSVKVRNEELKHG